MATGFVTLAPKGGVQSTAGAVSLINEKGQVYTEKVRVSRYVAGKRPEYAPSESSGSESDHGEAVFQPSGTLRSSKQQQRSRNQRDRSRSASQSDSERQEPTSREIASDSRLRRLTQRKRYEERRSRRQSSDAESSQSDDGRHRRPVRSPEVVTRGSQRRSSASSDESDAEREVRHRRRVESSDENEDVSDEELERRRAMLRLKARTKEDEELLAQEDEAASNEELSEEESEYEEYSDSEEETGPRLKPVFVQKKDRVTLQETEREQQRLKELQLEQKKLAEDRKKQSIKMVEEAIKREQEQERKGTEDKLNLESVNTDDENEELAYEAWKLRELKRIKRDKEERDSFEKDRQELERIHNMTEEERRAYIRLNPKVITNKVASKGKYKFMQKYYHRGVFYLDEEDNRMTRNFAEPTLEDHFDKTVLPKVMQVKNFGKAGRTKYTHLVDQDTTDYNSAWTSDTANNIKFFTKHAGGMKEVFERPSMKKRKRL